MRRSVRFRPRSTAAVGACAGASISLLALALALLVAGTGVGAGESAGVLAVPTLSPASAPGVALLGAATAGEPGEAWAFQNLPASTPPPRVGSRQLEFAPDDVSSSAQSPQPAFLRHTDATGWQIYETPIYAAGDPKAGQQIESFSPIRSSASVTARGGGALLGTIGAKPVALIRDPGPAGRYAAFAPPAEYRLVGGGSAAGAAAAIEVEAAGALKTGVFAAAQGSAAEGVLFFNGAVWANEPIDYPEGSSEFEILAIGATDAENAWLLADVSDDLERGVTLYRRSVAGGSPRWREQALGNSLISAASTASAGITNTSVLTSSARDGVDPLTVTADGLWIDGRFDRAGGTSNFTAFLDRSAGRVTGTWCDAAADQAPVCDHELGAAFSVKLGYRSTAWPGPGFGTRVVTNPLDPGTTADTNFGTYLKLIGDRFARLPGAGTNNKVDSALATDSAGWLTSHVRLQSNAPAKRQSAWSVGVRYPLQDVTGEPGKPVAGMRSGALAVGDKGGVARFIPGTGWVTEFLQSSSGRVRRPDLRGVAWPEPQRAHAVGSDGQMWLWRGDTGLWERDPGAPPGLETHLMDVAFRPGEPSEGFAVGREGLLLEYGKSWTPVPVCGSACRPGELPAKFARADFRQIAYSGAEAIVAAGDDVLVRRASGVWETDGELSALIARYRKRTGANGPTIAPFILTVAGLPDGAAMVAGMGGLAFRRESAGAKWEPLPQPLPELSITDSALIRDGGSLRSVITVSRFNYPRNEAGIEILPAQPLPQLEPLAMPSEGFLLRESAHGWTDEQGESFDAAGLRDLDKPAKPDPVLGLLVGEDGEGWLVGGVIGTRDSQGTGRLDETPPARVQTASVSRYSQAPQAPGFGAATPTPIAQSLTTVNFMVGGHAACANPRCSSFANVGIAPDRQLPSALAITEQMSNQLNGPRFFMYTGGRMPDGGSPLTRAEASRYAELLGSRPGLPTYAAVSAADSAGGNPANFRAAFAGFDAPFGDGPADPSISPRTTAGGQTRTHYSFDSRGTNGTIRVIVIDNSRGSLRASDPYQVPPVAATGGQENWLRGELRAAKADRTAAIVVGSRDLNSTFRPSLNAANDSEDPDEAYRVASMMRDEGASAYFFERPEENRYYAIPADGSPNPIPSFGTGTLGYRAEVSGTTTTPDAYFGKTGMLLAQVDVAARDPRTNRAPVTVRMIPLIESLNLEAIDGTLLRRSTPALFSGLGRRPVAGDRWGPGDDPSPSGSDPYTTYPTEKCVVSACQSYVEPEYEFRSADPDIADFVAVDPVSNNLRKPLLNQAGKAISSSRSGLLCAFNAGTTVVSVVSGGFTYSRQITVQPGTARQPCGTRPLDPRRFPAAQPKGSIPPPPPPPPSNPPLALALPPV
ncbi:MAG: hypothetical protein WAP37_05770, partial [Solirubrobacterales bacterium]